jgi:hypothetical protein
MAACREALDDGKEWSFYLINDSDVPLDWTALDEVSYEWGDMGNSEAADVRVTALAPGAHALVWRDDGSGAELRMEFSMRVRAREREVRMRFEFPRLYRKHDLPRVEGLDRPGWQVPAQSPLPGGQREC